MTKAILKTNTDLRRSPGIIGIYTYYVSYDKNIVFFISEIDKTVNTISFKQGELGYTNNDWDNTYFILNENGELIVVSDEADKFSININGELEYTYMGETRNLGQVSSFHAGTTPPINTSLIWYDTNEGVYVQKYWDILTADWTSFISTTEQVTTYRQDSASVNGETTITFRSVLPNTAYVVEILSYISVDGKEILSGWTIPENSKTVNGFTIIPPDRYTTANIVYRAILNF